MGSCTVFFNYILKGLNIKEEIFGKYTVGLMRSISCFAISYSGYKNFFYISSDICLEKNETVTIFKEYHSMFLSYFIYDTMILFYQVYLNIEKKIRPDLLFHHLLAIFALTLIDNYKLYSLTTLIGITEGMSIVSGPKLLSMHYGNKYITNIFIIYRLIYLLCIRMLFIWPCLLYYYNSITSTCPAYKENRNMYLVSGLLFIIINTELIWFHSGRKELARI